MLIDNAKSPLVATQMSASIPSLFGEQGIEAQVQVLHAGASTANTNPLLSQQLAVMPLVMLSLVASVIVAFIVAPVKGTVGAERRRQVAVQLATLLVTSAVIGLTVWVIVTAVGGFSLSAAGIVFFWLASAAIMTLLVGAFDILVLLGVLVALCIFALGMPCGALPVEMMPSFWQSWVYPWAPQHFIGNGLRDIAYMGAGAWPLGATQLAVICCVGLALLAAAAFMGRGERNADGAASEGNDAVSERNNGAASGGNGAVSERIHEQALAAESGQAFDA
ncbi:hypothetical protein [Actinobaculum sp. 313]|uniref:hypothetical protein n=1 Tax=Actinobaculum sp. 313 TaxID=2495645 RepID=UPI000F738DE0|nr:hypothetical protein [Actinobaculum sp. 313]